ncbi:hypothetical protein HSR122_3030 [Halapricum desulfuricans]|uniref:Uncharacterized protein n=1 Tax=Halapricum desulfuricans TaxID=2841257 RepID=A0A897NHN0_9EURY|nr:hypothetical protein HSR122_3030 [Halapricum desulfuricans]
MPERVAYRICINYEGAGVVIHDNRNGVIVREIVQWHPSLERPIARQFDTCRAEVDVNPIISRCYITRATEST